MSLLAIDSETQFPIYSWLKEHFSIINYKVLDRLFKFLLNEGRITKDSEGYELDDSEGLDDLVYSNFEF